MGYNKLLGCHVGDRLHADFVALAQARETTVSILLRQMIVREIHAPPDAVATILRHTLFLAVGIDGLLAMHEDRTLRPRTIELWRERLTREGFPRDA